MTTGKRDWEVVMVGPNGNRTVVANRVSEGRAMKVVALYTQAEQEPGVRYYARRAA